MEIRPNCRGKAETEGQGQGQGHDDLLRHFAAISPS